MPLDINMSWNELQELDPNGVNDYYQAIQSLIEHHQLNLEQASQYKLTMQIIRAKQELPELTNNILNIMDNNKQHMGQLKNLPLYLNYTKYDFEDYRQYLANVLPHRINLNLVNLLFGQHDYAVLDDIDPQYGNAFNFMNSQLHMVAQYDPELADQVNNMQYKLEWDAIAWAYEHEFDQAVLMQPICEHITNWLTRRVKHYAKKHLTHQNPYYQELMLLLKIDKA